jgi:prevent-host-death family protein
MDLVHDLVHNKNPMEVNVHEAKTNFSKLLQRVILGDEIIIAKAGVPVAKLVRYVTKKGKRPLGFYRGQIWMADDFDAPLPDDILARFYGEDVPDRKPVRRAPAKKRKKA